MILFLENDFLEQKKVRSWRNRWKPFHHRNQFFSFPFTQFQSQVLPFSILLFFFTLLIYLLGLLSARMELSTSTLRKDANLRMSCLQIHKLFLHDTTLSECNVKKLNKKRKSEKFFPCYDGAQCMHKFSFYRSIIFKIDKQSLTRRLITPACPFIISTT